MDVLLSIKQIQNVKNISFVILFRNIVHEILCEIFVMAAATAAMSTCCNTVQSTFLHEQFVEQGLFEERLHLQRTNLSKSAGAATCSVYTYIWDDKTSYEGSSPTLKDQRGLLPEISNPLVVDNFNKSVVGQLFLKEEVIQF